MLMLHWLFKHCLRAAKLSPDRALPCPSIEHFVIDVGADADAAGEYFDYSIDELGLQDIKAADALVNHIVSEELADS